MDDIDNDAKIKASRLELHEMEKVNVAVAKIMGQKPEPTTVISFGRHVSVTHDR